MRAYYNENDPYAAEWLRNLIAAGLIAEGEVDDRSIAEVTGAELAAFDQCHFFAGIGGWPLALRLAGWGDSRPVWTGSCPCQPFSAAGRGLGESDPRHLWPEFRRLIAECRTPTVFGEQVASAAGREWLARVRADLEALGYAVGAADLCAAGIGAPHIRQRLWWVADAGGERRQQVARGTFGDEGAHGRWPERNHVASGAGQDVCGLEHAARDGRQQWRPESGGWSAESRCGESGLGDASGSRLEVGIGDGGIRRDQRRTPEGQAAQLSGEAGGMGDANVQRHDGRGPRGTGRLEFANAGPWSDYVWIPCADGKARRIEPGLEPLAHGIPNRVGRLRAYGNAIVPQVAAEFITAFMEAVA